MGEAIAARREGEFHSDSQAMSGVVENIETAQVKVANVPTAGPSMTIDSGSDDDSPLAEMKENFRQWRAFWRTRKAVIQGERVFDYSSRELAVKGIMGPWRFNAAQSLASAFAAGTVALVLKILWPNHDAAETTATRVQTWLSTGIAPFSLLIVANLAAWASLWKEDHDNAKRRRAARAYLYYDAAYGFLPQSLLGIGSALAVGAYHAGNALQDERWKLILAGGLLWFIIWVWQVRLTSRTLPSKLFMVNGYSPSLRRLWNVRRKIENPGPYEFYRLVTYTAVPMLLGVLHLCVVGVSSATGYLLDR